MDELLQRVCVLADARNGEVVSAVLNTKVRPVCTYASLYSKAKSLDKQLKKAERYSGVSRFVKIRIPKKLCRPDKIKAELQDVVEQALCHLPCQECIGCLMRISPLNLPPRRGKQYARPTNTFKKDVFVTSGKFVATDLARKLEDFFGRVNPRNGQPGVEHPEAGGIPPEGTELVGTERRGRAPGEREVGGS